MVLRCGARTTEEGRTAPHVPRPCAVYTLVPLRDPRGVAALLMAPLIFTLASFGTPVSQSSSDRPHALVVELPDRGHFAPQMLMPEFLLVRALTVALNFGIKLPGRCLREVELEPTRHLQVS